MLKFYCCSLTTGGYRPVKAAALAIVMLSARLERAVTPPPDNVSAAPESVESAATPVSLDSSDSLMKAAKHVMPATKGVISAIQRRGAAFARPALRDPIASRVPPTHGGIVPRPVVFLATVILEVREIYKQL